MVKLIMAAALALGAFTGMPGATMAAPVASHNEITAYTPAEMVQYGRGEYRRDWRPSHGGWGHPGYGYDRRHHGPPSHARAYGCRNHHRY